MSYSWWATVGTDLLDREHAAGQVHEAHDVAGNAAGERREQVGRPLLQGNIPGEVQKGGVDCGRRNVQSHGPHCRISERPAYSPDSALTLVAAKNTCGHSETPASSRRYERTRPGPIIAVRER